MHANRVRLGQRPKHQIHDRLDGRVQAGRLCAKWRRVRRHLGLPKALQQAPDTTRRERQERPTAANQCRAGRGVGSGMGCVVPFRLPTHTDAPTQVGSRIILWVHGGGNIGTTAHQYLAFVGYLLSETTGQVVLLPSWPSAGAEPWPHALSQLVRCYRSLVTMYGAENIVVVGDSSGGGQALATLLAATSVVGTVPADSPDVEPEDPLPPPAGLGLVSPWADLADEAPWASIGSPLTSESSPPAVDSQAYRRSRRRRRSSTARTLAALSQSTSRQRRRSQRRVAGVLCFPALIITDRPAHLIRLPSDGATSSLLDPGQHTCLDMRTRLENGAVRTHSSLRAWRARLSFEPRRDLARCG